MYKGVIQRHASDLNRLLKILDSVIPPSMFLLIHDRDSSLMTDQLLWSLLVLVGAFSAMIFKLAGIYEPFRYRSLFTLMRRLSISWLMVISSLLFLAFATKTSLRFSRLEMCLWALLVWVVLLGIHVGSRQLLRMHRIRGGNSRRFIFWGSPEAAIRLFHECQIMPHLGLRMIAWFAPQSESPSSIPAGMPQCSGGYGEMRDFIDAQQVDHIFFNHVPEAEVSIDELVNLFGNTCVPVHYVPHWAHPGMSFQVEKLGNSFCIGLWGNDQTLIDRQLKRMMDIILSAIAIILLSPVFVIIALLIKATSHGPIFFLQDRYGLDGKPFKILKFRTMNVVERGDQLGLRQASRNDPRVTPVGRFLRRWSLDELPQLLNVLFGSMSLVGPRPHAVDHNEYYRERILGYMQRHLSKPGITGLAQVYGFRGETAELHAMVSRVEADLRYQREWNIMLDLKIMLKTLLSIRSPNAF